MKNDCVDCRRKNCICQYCRKMLICEDEGYHDSFDCEYENYKITGCWLFTPTIFGILNGIDGTVLDL